MSPKVVLNYGEYKSFVPNIVQHFTRRKYASELQVNDTIDRDAFTLKSS